jgi:probable phosphoglycerate mutase
MEMIRALGSVELDVIYSAPCQSALETAELLRVLGQPKIVVVDGLKNVDHGLWHGKLIDEVRRQSPTVFRAGQEHPERLQPPGGESLGQARQRLNKALEKIFHKRNRLESVALVISEPLATEARAVLRHLPGVTDLWKCECDAGSYESFEVDVEGAPKESLLRIAR